MFQKETIFQEIRHLENLLLAPIDTIILHLFVVV